eukprot:2186718-Pyramimonas_sp.AAC.1
MKDLIPIILFQHADGREAALQHGPQSPNVELAIRVGQQEGTRLGAKHDRPQCGIPQGHQRPNIQARAEPGLYCRRHGQHRHPSSTAPSYPRAHA